MYTQDTGSEPGGSHLLPIAYPTGLTEADLTPAFDSRFSSEQMALALHPTHGSDGEPRGWSVHLDEKEDAYQERQVLGRP